MYHTPHPDGTARGGTAIFVKNSIRHHEEPKRCTKAVQVTTISTKELRGDLQISTIYCPPNQGIEEEMFDELFHSLGPTLIIGGDWNSKHHFWGSRLVTPRGRVLRKSMDRYHCEVLSTGKPTRWPSDTTKTLYFFVCRGIADTYLSVEENYDSEGSHSPIIGTISTTVITKAKTPKLYYKKTDWHSYQVWLENNLNQKKL